MLAVNDWQSHWFSTRDVTDKYQMFKVHMSALKRALNKRDLSIAAPKWAS